MSNCFMTLLTTAQTLFELAALILAFLAFVSAIWFYFGNYKREERHRREDQHNRKISLLASLRQEIELNWALLHDPELPPRSDPDQCPPRYYNPTFQVFKYRDNAIVLALSQVESDILLDAELAQALLMVSYSIHFVNQQIDELMAYRFGSPERLAEASELVRKDTGLLEKFAADPNKIKPQRLRPYFRELALRNWAIVNKGYWDHLKPGLEALRQPLNQALQQAELEPVNMPVRQKVSPADTEASQSTDIVWVVNETSGSHSLSQLPS